MDKVDITIVGAGVIGLAIAYELAQENYIILLLEKNSTFGEETSSRNSEVIHAGIYYPKNSLKAELCVRGKKLLYEYCVKNNIPHKKVGKLIVAINTEEEKGLNEIYDNACNNGVDDLIWWNKNKIARLEPEIKAAKALFSPSTGIVDTHILMRSLLRKAEANGTYFIPATKVISIEPQRAGFYVKSEDKSCNCDFFSTVVINAAGLSAQSVAENISNLDRSTIPKGYLCKGNYFKLVGATPFTHLIYPVPEKNKTGLGIHATLDLQGRIRFGPDTEYVDKIDYQPTDNNLPQYYKAIRRYYPQLPEQGLKPDYSGIRPKLQGPGETAKDFVIQGEKEHKIRGLIQLFGLESPGLTSCLALAKKVRQSVQKMLPP